MKKKPVQKDYLYLDWEFKHSYPDNDERATISKVELKDSIDYENVMNVSELLIQSQFEDIQSWLGSQDLEFYESCEEDSECLDEQSFYTCVDVRNCSTLKADLCYKKWTEGKETFSETSKKEQRKEEPGKEESFYSLQLRRKSKTIFQSS